MLLVPPCQGAHDRKWRDFWTWKGEWDWWDGEKACLTLPLCSKRDGGQNNSDEAELGSNIVGRENFFSASNFQSFDVSVSRLSIATSYPSSHRFSVCIFFFQGRRVLAEATYTSSVHYWEAHLENVALEEAKPAAPAGSQISICSFGLLTAAGICFSFEVKAMKWNAKKIKEIPFHRLCESRESFVRKFGENLKRIDVCGRYAVQRQIWKG